MASRRMERPARSQTSSLDRSLACWPKDTSKPSPISGFRWTVSAFLLREAQADGTGLGGRSTPRPPSPLGSPVDLGHPAADDCEFGDGPRRIRPDPILARW